MAQLFVGQVHGVTGLEGDDAFPATLGDLVTDFHGGAEGIREFGLEVAEIQDFNRAGDSEAALAVEGGYPGVFHVFGAIDLLGHGLHLGIADLFDSLHIHHGQHRVAIDIGVTQGNAFGTFDGIHIFQQAHHRDREERTIREGHFLGGAHGVGDIHKAFQWAEIATTHHHGIASSLGANDHGRQ